MEKESYEIFAEKLLDCYSQLYDLSVNQQKVLSGQSDIPLKSLIDARSSLFTEIEQLQKNFHDVEKKLISKGNQKVYKEIQDLRRLFQQSIERITKSDKYLELLLQERKRQIIDKLQQIERSKVVETQYRKMSGNLRLGPMFSDTPRFYDQRK